MKKHATVRIGEYVIPLIGISVSETQETCDSCGKIFHLADVELDFSCKIKCVGCKKTVDVSAGTK